MITAITEKRQKPLAEVDKDIKIDRSQLRLFAIPQKIFNQHDGSICIYYAGDKNYPKDVAKSD